MTATAQHTTLHALRDRSRPLLVFAPADDSRVQQQISDLRDHAAGLRDRDMRIVLVPSPAHVPSGDSQLPFASFSPSEEQHARELFHVRQDEFTVILVGKDGGEKLRSASPLTWQRLSSTIDSMPMRQSEMRQR